MKDTNRDYLNMDWVLDNIRGLLLIFFDVVIYMVAICKIPLFLKTPLKYLEVKVIISIMYFHMIQQKFI